MQKAGRAGSSGGPGRERGGGHSAMSASGPSPGPVAESRARERERDTTPSPCAARRRPRRTCANRGRGSGRARTQGETGGCVVGEGGLSLADRPDAGTRSPVVQYSTVRPNTARRSSRTPDGCGEGAMWGAAAEGGRRRDRTEDSPRDNERPTRGEQNGRPRVSGPRHVRPGPLRVCAARLGVGFAPCSAAWAAAPAPMRAKVGRGPPGRRASVDLRSVGRASTSNPPSSLRLAVL